MKEDKNERKGTAGRKRGRKLDCGRKEEGRWRGKEGRKRGAEGRKLDEREVKGESGGKNGGVGEGGEEGKERRQKNRKE